jgi:hypothetical protein
MRYLVSITLASLVGLGALLVTGCDSIQNAIYKSAIQKAIHEDALTGNAVSADHVNAMRQVDLTDCPPEFREAYSHHIHAWQEAVQVQLAKTELDKDEDAAAVEGILATVFDLDATPWGDHVQAENQVQQLQAKANGDIESTWQEVEDVGRKYGVQM